MIRSIRLGLIGSTVALMAMPALAQTAAPTADVPSAAPAAHAAHAEAVPANSTEAYEQAMEKMHMAMMVQPTGDADVDFVRGMIPHHQGAIDMARIQLEFGDDPDLHRMSEEIIKAQEKEIATMQDWLQKNAPDAAAADAAKMESLSANPATGAALVEAAPAETEAKPAN